MAHTSGHHKPGAGPGGFTLIELLVVTSIIALLMAILLPALRSAREFAREAVCINNMRQIMLGMSVYDSDYQIFPDATDTASYNLHPTSNERRAARWFLFFNEYVGGSATPDPTYAAWNSLAAFELVASPVWNGCPSVQKAQSMERFHYGVFDRGEDEDGNVYQYPTMGLKPYAVPQPSAAGIIGESNASVLDGGKIQGDTLFYMKDFRLGERTGAGGFQAFQRHGKAGFNVGYLDGHVAFYSYPVLTWYRLIVRDIVAY